jgi:hypothetical protein
MRGEGSIGGDDDQFPMRGRKVCREDCPGDAGQPMAISRFEELT